MNSSDTSPVAINLDDDDRQDIAGARGVRLTLWRSLWRYACRHPRLLWTIALCALVTAAMDVSFPLITRAVIDEVSLHGAEARLAPLMALYALATITIVAAVNVFIRAAGALEAGISHDIRQDGFENLQRLSFAYYDRRPVGWLMARMTSDCDRLSDILSWGILDAAWGISVMIGMIGVMLALDASLALIVLTVLPIVWWVSRRFQRRLLSSARRVRAVNSRITASYNEGIMGVLTSKAFVQEAHNERSFGHLTEAANRASVQNLTQAAVYLPIVVTLASLAIGLVLAAGGHALLQGAISTGTLIAFLAYARQLFEPVEELGARFAQMQMAQASAERVLSLIATEPEVRDTKAVRLRLAAQANRSQAYRSQSAEVAPDGGDAIIESIELDGVSFAYSPPPAEPVLQHIDLQVTRGETIAIVGPTGGGKSSLVNLICRFHEPTEGSVKINGVDYRDRSLDWFQSTLGIVLQDAHVFSGSIMENIRYGCLSASDQAVIEAARLAGAHEFIVGFENGYQAESGEGGSRLSTGQKQLISVARAILADPQILVMDEATSSIDTGTERRIQKALERLLSGRIAFVIAHRLSTIRRASRIIVIDQGHIIEQGTHAELMVIDGRYRHLYQLQSLAI